MRVEHDQASGHTRVIAAKNRQSHRVIAANANGDRTTRLQGSHESRDGVHAAHEVEGIDRRIAYVGDAR